MACGTTCDPGSAPPASIWTAQQRMCVLVFVEVERGVCGDRGACCAVTTVCWVGSCAYIFFLCEGSSLSLHV